MLAFHSNYSKCYHKVLRKKIKIFISDILNQNRLKKNQHFIHKSKYVDFLSFLLSRNFQWFYKKTLDFWEKKLDCSVSDYVCSSWISFYKVLFNSDTLTPAPNTLSTQRHLLIQLFCFHSIFSSKPEVNLLVFYVNYYFILCYSTHSYCHKFSNLLKCPPKR